MMKEHKRDDRSYILYLVIVFTVIALVLGYGYYERQRRTEVFVCIVATNNLDAIREALNRDPWLADARERTGGTALSYTSSEDGARMLIAKGADVNARDRRGRTPLHSAAENGKAQVLEALLSHNADINARDNEGATPLCLTLRAVQPGIGGERRKALTDCAAVIRRHGGKE